jgi:hypothetical protein
MGLLKLDIKSCRSNDRDIASERKYFDYACGT